MKQEFDLIFKIVVLFGVLVLHFTGCGTEPEFERDNKNDPSSDNFVPDLPTVPNILIDILDDRNIKLTWNIPQLYDGALLYKKYKDTTELMKIDSLDGSTNSFIDSSKVFTVGTSYSLKPFRRINESTIVFTEEEITNEIIFKEFKNVNIDYSLGRLIVSYENHPKNSNSVFNNLFDGIDLYINRSSKEEDEEWIYLQTVHSDEFSDNSFDTGLSFEVFDLKIRVDQFIYDDTTKIFLKNFYKTQIIHSLTLSSFEINDELSGQLLWKTSLDGSDSILIQSDVINNLIKTSVNDLSINFKENYTYPFFFSITPFIGNNIGLTKNIGPYSPKLPEISIEGFEPITETSIELKWNTSFENDFAGFIIESIVENTDEYTPIDTLLSDKRSIMINNMDTTSQYGFRIRSYTSDHSEVLNIDFVDQLFIESQTALDTPGRSPLLSKNDKYLVKIKNDNISIKNQKTNEEYQLILPKDEWGRAPTILDFAVSEATNSIAVIIDLDNVDICCSFLILYDIITGEILVNDSISYGTNLIQTAQNDSSYIVKHNGDRIISLFEFNPFSASNVMDMESKNHIPGQVEMINYTNSVLHCNRAAGLVEIELKTNTINSILNEPCFGIVYKPSEKLIIIRTLNSIKIIDLNTKILLNSFLIDKESIPEIWVIDYLKQSGILIYIHDWDVHRYIINGNIYEIIIPSLTGRNGTRINYIEHISDNRYKLNTYDSEFIVDINKTWAILPKN